MNTLEAIKIAAATVIGFGAATLATPAPEPSNDCAVYKVARKSAVSYVLRPPFQPAPVFEPPLIPPVKVAETAPEPEPVAAAEPDPEEKPRRRYRHMRRHRRIW